MSTQSFCYNLGSVNIDLKLLTNKRHGETNDCFIFVTVNTIWRMCDRQQSHASEQVWITDKTVLVMETWADQVDSSAVNVNKACLTSIIFQSKADIVSAEKQTKASWINATVIWSTVFFPSVTDCCFWELMKHFSAFAQFNLFFSKMK